MPRAITALICQERSLLAARKFVHAFFLSREIDLRGMLKFSDPKKALAEMVLRFNRERPQSRMLKETGRFSSSPVYVVGIYTGSEQLGEGFGSSLKMAEFRVSGHVVVCSRARPVDGFSLSQKAAEDALHRVYLTRTPDDQLQLPTSTLGADLFQDETDGRYEAAELPAPEIMYASSGRTGIILADE